MAGKDVRPITHLENQTADLVREVSEEAACAPGASSS
jgi:hypothetical protein